MHSCCIVLPHLQLPETASVVCRLQGASQVAALFTILDTETASRNKRKD